LAPLWIFFAPRVLFSPCPNQTPSPNSTFKFLSQFCEAFFSSPPGYRFCFLCPFVTFPASFSFFFEGTTVTLRRIFLQASAPLMTQAHDHAGIIVPSPFAGSQLPAGSLPIMWPCHLLPTAVAKARVLIFVDFPQIFYVFPSPCHELVPPIRPTVRDFNNYYKNYDPFNTPLAWFLIEDYRFLREPCPSISSLFFDL